jgi:glutathione peroxidase-family protein
MMASLQATYKDEPDFTMLLFPCNQFMEQEPHANSVVEQFAATYLNLTASTVRMFAKSDVNGPCASTAPDACAASSEDCCPANNAVYVFNAPVARFNSQIPIMQLKSARWQRLRGCACGLAKTRNAPACGAPTNRYSFLQSVVPGKCSWNFNKYVVGRDGKPSSTRFGDEDLADKLTPVIDALLKQKQPGKKNPLKPAAVSAGVE